MQIKDEFGCVLCDVQPQNGRLFLGKAMLRRAQLQHCNLRGAFLSCADLRGANLDGADLSGALLDDADLTDASLTETRLAGANLQRAKLVDARLSRVDLSSAVLKSGWESDCPVLTGATIERCNLSGQRLKGDFSQVSFQGSDLSKAVLIGALTCAKFTDAILSETWLVSDFQFTSFADADLSQVRVRKVLETKGGFGPVRWTKSTKWPKGIWGYCLAYTLLRWDEIHPVGIALISATLILFLRAADLVQSWTSTALWMCVFVVVAVALRVVYLRHQKNSWL